MSNYKTHVKFNLGFGLPVLLIAGIYYLQPSALFVGIFMASFIYTSLYMGPDMDLAKSIRLFSLRGILTLPFRSYSRLFHHRGLSHSALFGTITRLLWLVIWLGLYSYFLDFFFGWKLQSPLAFWQNYKIYLLYMIAGVFFADLFHLILDLKKA